MLPFYLPNQPQKKINVLSLHLSLLFQDDLNHPRACFNHSDSYPSQTPFLPFLPFPPFPASIWFSHPFILRLSFCNFRDSSDQNLLQ
ncbi:hypothetical protein V6Z12_D13G115800 [Gossypium hirsutum]